MKWLKARGANTEFLRERLKRGLHPCWEYGRLLVAFLIRNGAGFPNKCNELLRWLYLPPTPTPENSAERCQVSFPSLFSEALSQVCLAQCCDALPGVHTWAHLGAGWGNRESSSFLPETKLCSIDYFLNQKGLIYYWWARLYYYNPLPIMKVQILPMIQDISV